MTDRTATEEILTKTVGDWFNAGCPDIPDLGHTNKRNLLCPAAMESHGSEVFGIFEPSEGQIRYLDAVIPLPSVVRDIVESDQLCERTRISADCQTLKCHYWQGGCRLGWFVSRLDSPSHASDPLCAISDRCRWQAEYGDTVCKGCSKVRAISFQ
jgi:hypothetical protein